MSEHICVSAPPGRYSLLLRVHMYACFVAGSYHTSSRPRRPLRAAHITFALHLAVAAVDVRLFGALAPGEAVAPGVDLVFTYRAINLGLYLCSEHLEWFLPRISNPRRRLAAGPAEYLSRALLAILFALNTSTVACSLSCSPRAWWPPSPISSIIGWPRAVHPATSPFAQTITKYSLERRARSSRGLHLGRGGGKEWRWTKRVAVGTLGIGVLWGLERVGEWAWRVYHHYH